MDTKERIAELEEQLKRKDEKIADLRAELDQAVNLFSRQNEQVEGGNEIIDGWIEAFDMVLGDDGKWQWQEGLDQKYDALLDKYVGLLRRWNSFVPRYNNVVAPTYRNVGRPIRASDAEQLKVLDLHAKGYSLREIEMEFADISIRTIRTIIDKKDGTDRATMARLERIAPDKAAEARERRLARMRKTLPKRLNEHLANGRALIKEARGFGK